MATPVPVVLVGRVGQMGRLVAENLLPEVEGESKDSSTANVLTFAVIHFISKPETARKDLPRFLNNEQPTDSSDDGIGSQDYSRQPQAILLGLGYYNEIFDDLREACRTTIRGVPWVRGGLSKSEFDELMANNPPASIPHQAPITANKIKKKVLQVLKDGEGGKDGVFEWHDRSVNWNK